MNYKDELNENQYKAVTSDAQFLRIIAGAGSGKTRVLTYRIAYLIEQMHVYPNKILAITFTNKVAKEMKERTIKLLPDYDLKGLSISTFHSFCARFLRSEISELGFPQNFFIMDDTDSLQLIKNIGETFGYKRTDENNTEAYDFIKKQKCYGRLPSDCEKMESLRLKSLFIRYFKEYERRKNELYQLDFDDLLIYTIKILETNDLIRDKWINKFNHILIDEFQDTNDLQFKLLTLLTDSHSNVYVVGDPDQTIYTWRGANQDIIMRFGEIYSPLTTIALEENYRSTPNILNISNQLISHNPGRFDKNLYTSQPKGAEVSLKNFANAINEAYYIANKINEIKIRNKNVKYSDIAVLFRSVYLTQKLENVLVAKQIPYKVYGSLKFYARAEVKDCLAYFKLIVNEDDDISFERIINIPRRGIGDKTLAILKLEAESNHVSMIKYLKNLHKYDSKLPTSLVSKLEPLFGMMDHTREKIQANEEAYSEILDEFITDIKYKDFLEEKDETKDKVLNVVALINDVRDYLKDNPESNFDEYLQNVTLYSAQDDIDNSDSVSLMTVHTAKGLEFDYVFIMGLEEGVFPNNRALLESPKAIEEERRLAYVACTRAKKELYLSYNTGYSFVSRADSQPSRFIKEMGLKVDVYSFGNNNSSSSNAEDSKKYYYQNTSNSTGNLGTLNLKNDIVWHVGDTAVHQSFGEGEVLTVEGDIITVNFKDFGVKKLIGSHPKLSRKEKVGH